METTAASEPHASLWEDFLDVFYAPREVFARREDGRWPVILLVLTLVMLFLYFASQSVLAPAYEAEMARAMRGTELTAEQMEQARRVSGIFGVVAFAVAFPVGVMVLGVAVWAVGKLFDSAAPLAGALLISVFAQFPRILQQLVGVGMGLVMDPASLRSIYSVTLSPASLLDPDAVSPLLLALAGRLDLFVLWSTVLVAIGLQVRGRVPKGLSYLAALLVWLLGTLPTALGALAGGG